MKKIILSITLFLTSISFSQEHPWFAGGGLNANYTSNNANTSTKWSSNWAVSPEIGKYVTEKIQVGGSLTFGEFKAKYVSGNIGSNAKLGFAIYSRYLFGNLSFKPFVGFKAGYEMSGQNWSEFSNGTSITSAYFDAGFAYSLAPRWTVFGSYGMLGFTSSRTKLSPQDVVVNSVGVNLSSLGNRFLIGMYYNFGHSK